MKDPKQKRGKLKAVPKKWLLGGILALIVLGSIGVLGKLYYPKFNAERLLTKSRAFLAGKDYQSASITALRTLQMDEKNVGAVRVLVKITEDIGSAAVVEWKSLLAKLEPATLENQLSLAESALNFGKLPIANEALAAAQESGKGRARYHALAGRAALAAKDEAKAEVEFAEAAKLEPTNGLYQLRWHAGRLRSSDPEIKKQARGVLDALLEQPDVFPQTSRLLIGDAIERRDANRALALAQELEKTPVATFQDDLVYLGLLYQLDKERYANYLTKLQDEVAQNPEHTYSLMLWLNDRQSALLVVDWAKRLPPEVTGAIPVSVALAQSYVRLRDWARLKPIISDTRTTAKPALAPTKVEATGKWGDFEFLRLAYLAVVRRAEGDQKQSKILWNAAAKAAADRPVAVTALARYAADWGWEAESTDLLWKVARETPDPLWALDVLYRHYEATQSAAGLQQVARRILEIQPVNPDMKNNAAMLSLLLGTNVAEAVETARVLSEGEPTNANYLSTYALGLFLQGYAGKAADVMKKIDPEKLKQPAVAVYYGLVLSGTDAKEEARGFLQLASEARLLPEEKKLMAQAWARIDNPAPAETAPPVR